MSKNKFNKGDLFKVTKHDGVTETLYLVDEFENHGVNHLVLSGIAEDPEDFTIIPEKEGKHLPGTNADSTLTVLMDIANLLRNMTAKITDMHALVVPICEDCGEPITRHEDGDGDDDTPPTNSKNKLHLIKN